MAYFVIMICVLFTMLAPTNYAMIETYTHLKIGYEVRSLDQFKFDRGGTLQMNGYFMDSVAEPPVLHKVEEEEEEEEDKGGEAQEAEASLDAEEKFSIGIYHCSDKEIEELNAYSSMHKLCENIENFECSYKYDINNDNEQQEISYSFTSLKPQWMTMIIISCTEHHTFDISSLRLESVSKANEYLSLNEMNYKFIFLWLSLTYGLLFVAYAVHLWRFRHWNVKLQCVLLFYPLLQCVLCVFSHLYWNYCSQHGVRSNNYLLLCYILDSVCMSYLAAMALCICLGWHFMNNYIEPPHCYKLKAEMVAITVAIVVCSILQNYFNSLLLFNVICYILCCRRMLKCYTENVKLLQSQISILTEHEHDYEMAHLVEKSPANIKLNMFKCFQKLIVVLVALKVICYWVSSLLLYEYAWINDIILNAMNVLFVLALFYNFRMSRPFKPYFYLIDEQYEYEDINTRVKGNKEIDYNLSFECDLLIIENDLRLEPQSEFGFKSYMLATPFTIEVKHRHTENNQHEHVDDRTPLLMK